MSDLFGFEKAIQLDHLTDKQINELEEILKDYQQIAACRLDKSARRPQSCGVGRVVKSVILNTLEF